MKKKPQPNPDYRPLTLSVQRDYIRSAQHAYWKTKKYWDKVIYSDSFSLWFGDDYAYWELISWYYQIGRMWGQLAIPYDEFEGYLLAAKPGGIGYQYRRLNIPESPEEKHKRYQTEKHKYRWCYRSGDYWHDNHGVGYREQMKFKRNPHHKKKTVTLEEEQKRDWKKTKRTHREWRYSKKWVRADANRAERRRIKMRMQTGDWDDYTKGMVWYDRHWSESAGDWADYTHPNKREFLNPWDWD